MPPSIARGYEFCLDSNFEDGKAHDLGTLGEEMGKIKLEDGTEIQAGRVMMRDQWNTEFFPSLVQAAESQDIWVNKNRLNGFWGGTKVEEALRDRGIRTLLFAGENTDQCVQASIQGAYTQGWDVLMITDNCATSSPEFVTKCTEFNCKNGWGFVLTSKQLVDGIDDMETGPDGGH